ncbi:hypothetical protein HN858_05540 [Candidatus Falkowbacteria bacterium]|mgnify:CR=1 FL=1|jgi:hypothetical protein|nr:hypothetical protein [Candidatus Falkowbacteria bacterium]MBT5502913.1 hypothetical protein [Candidatus Falkowbacteria bacterium]MBT6573723.1 hypothetical protein [Candidatus Falkowbacteria bacterium]MBT7349099.1 hypothetical protein [Candidatus Falkowbacteria bacterium]MBT7500050.1 hypothetical protein [Candidatus Falkowbacteria bacterium]
MSEKWFLVTRQKYILKDGKIEERTFSTSFGAIGAEKVDAIFKKHGLGKESLISDPLTDEPLYLPEGTKVEEVDGKLVITLGCDVTMKDGSAIYGYKITEVDGPEED